MSKARQVIAALRRDPALLYEVLQGLHEAEVKVAGPWDRRTMTYRERRDPAGKLLCRVAADESKPLPWRAALSKDLAEFTPKAATGEQLRERAFPSEGDALEFCDLALTYAKYILAS